VFRIAIAALILTAACGSSEAQVDPYDRYLEIAPAGEKVLSREDAQARALLGCGQDYAPGTVDAALATAYDPECD
jgi:hypothetical protein